MWQRLVKQREQQLCRGLLRTQVWCGVGRICYLTYKFKLHTHSQLSIPKSKCLHGHTPDSCIRLQPSHNFTLANCLNLATAEKKDLHILYLSYIYLHIVCPKATMIKMNRLWLRCLKLGTYILCASLCQSNLITCQPSKSMCSTGVDKVLKTYYFIITYGQTWPSNLMPSFVYHFKFTKLRRYLNAKFLTQQH